LTRLANRARVRSSWSGCRRLFRWRLRRYKASRGLSIFRRSERMIRYNYQRGRGHQNVANALAKSSRCKGHTLGLPARRRPRHRLSSNHGPAAVIRRLKPESSGPVTAEGFSARRVWSDVVGTKLDAKAAVQIVLDRNGGLHASFGRTFAPKIAAQSRIRLISTPPGPSQIDIVLQETIKGKLDPYQSRSWTDVRVCPYRLGSF